LVDSLLAVIDRPISLFALREKRQDRLFSELWEPTFNDLLVIHRDYIEMFEKVGARLSKMVAVPSNEKGRDETSQEIAEVVEYLSHKRIEFEPVRQKLITLIDTIPKSGLDERASAYVDALVWYFPIGVPRRSSTAASEVLTQIEAHRKIIQDSAVNQELTRMSLSDLINYVHRVIQRQRHAWSIVCETYAPLTLAHAKRTIL